ncbi:MAG: IS110 family transposase, partial [Bacteroidetes bacterium]|nr:IS110 family transposase [Bacteroidota bacterium]
YYERKVAEGKNKMSVLNAVRNKIIHRVFAVIKSQTPYKFDLVLS